MSATCSTCRFWSKQPIKQTLAITGEPATEHFCHLTRDMGNALAYGQDGKAILTSPTFGCNQHQPKS